MKIVDYLTAKPARFFLVAALLWMALMNVLNNKMGIQWKDILVEANGMAFDLLVFGILLSVYEALREKKELIARLREEIDDYGGWEGDEASVRIAAIIKRLNKLGVSKIKLLKCHIKNAELIHANLGGAWMLLSNFNGSKLSHANLRAAMIYRTSFEDAILVNTQLQGARIEESNLKGAKIGSINVDELMKEKNVKGIDLEKSTDTNLIIPGANFKNAILRNNDLEGAIVGLDWFENIEAWNVIGREEIMEKYQIDANGILQLK